MVQEVRDGRTGNESFPNGLGHPMAEGPGPAPKANNGSRKPGTHSVCDECGGTNIVNNPKEKYCNDCGLVLDESPIDYGAEWSAASFEEKEKRSRVGAPSTLTIHDKGLMSTISRISQDWNGKSVPPKNRAQMYRLMKLQRRTRIRGSVERNLVHALTEIDRMASAKSLSKDVRETAALLYRDALHKHLCRGRSIEGVATALLLKSAKLHGINLTLDEITGVSKVSKKEINRTYRFLNKGLYNELEELTSNGSAFQKYVTTGEQARGLVPRFCSDLGLNGEISMQAIDYLNRMDQMKKLSGKGPQGLAAAAIYITAILNGKKDEVSQKRIAEVASVTEVTIRNRYKEMAKELDLDVTL